MHRSRGCSPCIVDHRTAGKLLPSSPDLNPVDLPVCDWIVFRYTVSTYRISQNGWETAEHDRRAEFRLDWQMFVTSFDCEVWRKRRPKYKKKINFVASTTGSLSMLCEPGILSGDFWKLLWVWLPFPPQFPLLSPFSSSPFFTFPLPSPFHSFLYSINLKNLKRPNFIFFKGILTRKTLKIQILDSQSQKKIVAFQSN